MYAIIHAGGRQVKVSPGQEVKVDRVGDEVGSHYALDKVLFVFVNFI